MDIVNTYNYTVSFQNDRRITHKKTSCKKLFISVFSFALQASVNQIRIAYYSSPGPSRLYWWRGGPVYPKITIEWTPHYTYLLTPWCSVLLEKLTGLQLVKKSLAFYRTGRFITAFTSFRRPSLSWASPIQFHAHNPPPGDPS